MKIEEQRKLGENMRLLRNARGYTQAQVAEELHICRSTYTLYELGKKLPSIDLLVDLARLYHVRLDVLFDSKTSLYVQYVFSQEQERKEVTHLVEAYYQLPAQAQGRLLERAEVLLNIFTK
ncbi:MAG: helix-turn-helix transcriptional regulator [Firmicutes bacterium]|nr:helix-turn-helix transcriptional regulator [Bacillota bacterium]